MLAFITLLKKAPVGKEITIVRLAQKNIRPQELCLGKILDEAAFLNSRKYC
jgi:hypothetical protein